MTRARESSLAPRLGGKTALATFVAVIFAFVGETQLTQVKNFSSKSATLLINQSLSQYVQTTLGYQHSFFLL